MKDITKEVLIENRALRIELDKFKERCKELESRKEKFPTLREIIGDSNQFIFKVNGQIIGGAPIHEIEAHSEGGTFTLNIKYNPIY